MLRKCISCGRFELFILIIIISSLLNNCLYGLNHNEIFKEVRLCSESFSNHYLIHELWSYLGTFIIAFVLNIKEIRASKPKEIEIEEEKTNKEEETKKREKAKGFIKLIYNPISNKSEFTSKIIFFYFLIIFIWVLIDQVIEYIYIMIFQDLDFWMIELFSIYYILYLNELIFSKIKITLYIHQKLAIILSIIPSLLKIGSIIISFFDKTEESNNYTGKLPIYYIQKPFLKIPIGFLIYIFLITLRSYVNLTLKWYMDKLYISYYKILTVYGGIGTFVYGLICLLTTFIKCKEINKEINIGNNSTDYCDYLAKVKKNNTENEIITYYFDSYNIYFSNFVDLKESLIEILIIIVGIITFFYKRYSSLLVIHFLNPAYVIFTIPIKFLLQKVVSLSYLIPKANREYFTKDHYKLYKFFLDTLGDIFSLFGFLIFLEIVVLHCYKLDSNIKQNIMFRAFMDQKEEIGPLEPSENDDEIDEDKKILDNSKNSESLLSI